MNILKLAGMSAVSVSLGMGIGIALRPYFPTTTEAAPVVMQKLPETPASHGAGQPANIQIFRELGKRIVPSVVNISTTTGTRRQSSQRFRTPEDMLEEFFGYHRPNPRADSDAAPQRRAASLGTGFIIDSSGIILTNHHVVAGADEISVTFTESSEEKPTPGKVIARDPELDIALISVKTDRKLTPLPLGDSDALEVGDYVAAVGNPFGQGHSLTHGIVSAKGRVSPIVPLATYIQTDAPINPGNSGGPLVNLNGEVIGINNAIDARAQGIGFAIPINVVKKILPELQRHGTIARGYIGVVVSELNPELAEKISVSKEVRAPLVMQVAPGGPAFKAGIRPYDVIMEFNGKAIHTPSELTSEVTALAEGATVPVKISRADKTLEVKIRLGKRPAAEEG